MKKQVVNKTYREINDKIKSGQVVVVTAEEMIDIVKKEGAGPSFWPLCCPANS